MLNAYVKEGYRSMHENIKDILFPLRLLRKGGYRLFSYDERINKNIDLNMFKSKEQMTIFLNSVKEEFKQDEILQAKNNTPEELEEIMKRETQASVMRYSYNEEKIVEEKKDLNPYDSIALKSEKNPKTAKQANEIAKKKFELEKQVYEQKEIKEKNDKENLNKKPTQLNNNKNNGNIIFYIGISLLIFFIAFILYRLFEK